MKAKTAKAKTAKSKLATSQEPNELQRAVAFHGHLCPGLVLGYRASRLAMRRFGLERAYDEELICVVENDSCSVDAVQSMTGCTFGKGNLIFRDYGKQVFTFARRAEIGRALRVSLKPLPSLELPDGASREDMRRAKIEQFLSVPDTEMFWADEVTVQLPPRASVIQSAACENCSEQVMESRLRQMAVKRLCVPCSEGWDTSTI
ncbi:MAG: FmdE family protein, partial [Candidatus Geothermincolia bacterium]